MSYFKNFPNIAYKFGNAEKTVNFQQLSIFSDVLDVIKDNVTVYLDAYVNYKIVNFPNITPVGYTWGDWDGVIPPLTTPPTSKALPAIFIRLPIRE